MSSNEDRNEQKFDNTADQHRCLEFIAFSYDRDDTYCPIRCDASLCDYLHTIQVITQHIRTRFGRAAFVHEITSFGKDPREYLAILEDCCRNYEREEEDDRNSASVFLLTHDSAS